MAFIDFLSLFMASLDTQYLHGQSPGEYRSSVGERDEYTGRKWRTGDIVRMARKVALRTLHQLAVAMPEVMENKLNEIVPPIVVNTIGEDSEEADRPSIPNGPESQELVDMASVRKIIESI
jgi:hypothetical protein